MNIETVFPKAVTITGFTIEVVPLPPYYMDVVEESIPLLDHPKREVQLLGGATDYFPYDPPDEVPSKDDREEYEMYMRWAGITLENANRSVQRDRVRRDFALSNCVRIKDGPYTCEDDEWLMRVSAAFEDFHYPTNEGARRLLFIKTQIITTSEENEWILNHCMFPEVTMQGVENSLRRFCLVMEERTADRRHEEAGRGTAES